MVYKQLDVLNMQSYHNIIYKNIINKLNYTEQRLFQSVIDKSHNSTLFKRADFKN